MLLEHLVDFLQFHLFKRITVPFLQKNFDLFTQFKEAGENSPAREPANFCAEK